VPPTQLPCERTWRLRAVNRLTRAAARPGRPERGPLVVRVMFPSVWDTVPALVIPAPVLFLERNEGNTDVPMAPRMS
jgi:hypothetical protein